MNCCRVSPYENGTTKSLSESSSATSEANGFGFLDSLWFGAGALMQQGSDGNPQSVSLRYSAMFAPFTLVLPQNENESDSVSMKVFINNKSSSVRKHFVSNTFLSTWH